MHYRITTLRAVLLLCLVGAVTYLSGFSGPFIGDDIPQIVNNPPVHSISNIASFFGGSTFYTGDSTNPLGSGSYRPLMTVVFSLIYSVFGAQPLAFHAVQLGLHIACALLIFAIFGYFLKRPLSLALALIFLVQPINSMAVYSVSALQEPLFTLFGLLAFWLLLRTQKRSQWYLLVAAGCLLLSLLAKETGILFVVVCLLYLLLTSRRRFWVLLAAVTAIMIAYGLLRINAVGFLPHYGIAPIENLSLSARLLNIPAIIWFYVAHLVLPLGLAQGYYWAYDRFTFAHFILPLLLDSTVIGLLVYAGRRLTKHHARRYFNQYCFFSAWLAVGTVFVLQIFPLDMTASETWLYFPIIGLLGMAGALYEALVKRPRWRQVGLAIAVVVTLLFGIRTLVRGFDWHDQTTLSYHNIAVSKEDYVSYNLIANHYVRLGQYGTAQSYANKSIALYPSFINYNTLGAVLVGLGDYPAAQAAFYEAIKYDGGTTLAYENLALLIATEGSQVNPNSNSMQFYQRTLVKFPQDSVIWFYFAIYANNHGAHNVAVTAVQQAQYWGYFEQAAYDAIMQDRPYPIQLNNVTK